MHITHIGIWTGDIERLAEFYSRWFGAQRGTVYHNPATGFTSLFLSFDTGARLELMTRPGYGEKPSDPAARGLAHLALELEGPEQVAELTRSMEAAGVTIASQPRYTGDGYFESVILDPDGNRVELSV